MPDLTRCNQEGCTQPAAFRFTWPGNDEKGICVIHVERAKMIAQAMGFHLQIIPIEKESSHA